MTTSVIYGSSLRGQDIQYGSVSPAVTATTIGLASPFTNLSTFLTTKVTRTRFTNATGSTTNPTATFSATPANGSALIAVILRTADNTTTTMTGWTQLSNAGAGGVRQAAVWWKRAGASEPTVVTATNATATAWNMTIIEYGGWAALADPVSISNSATVASTTNITVPGTGMHAGVCAIVTGAGSWTTATLADDVGNNASYTQFAATTLANCSEIVGYNNYEDATAKYTLGTARATNRLVVGWPHNTTSAFAPFGTFAGIQTNGGATEGQIGIEFDTTTIPALNTVSAATLTMKAGSTPPWPSVATSEIYSINSTAIAKTASNTRTLWRTPTEVAALTKVATRAAGSPYVASTAYAWTSEAAFISNISQGGTTRLLVGTSEQRTGSLAGSSQVYNISSTAGDHFITIVHSYLGAQTVTSTLTTTSNVSRAVSKVLTSSSNLVSTLSKSVLSTLATTLSPAIDIAKTLSKTISSSITPVVNIIKSVAIRFASVLSIAANTLTQYVPSFLYDPAARVLRLIGRTTLRLTQDTVLRLRQRTHLRLPKE